MAKTDPLRDQLVRFLDWKEAHVDFEGAIKGIPPDKRGATPPGFPHSPWQLLEHLRIAQEDIHDFCVNPKYQEMKWPDDYWPPSAPPNAKAWDESVAAYRRDLEKMKELVRHQPDLFAPIPHGRSPHRPTSERCCSSSITRRITSGKSCSCGVCWEFGRREGRHCKVQNLEDESRRPGLELWTWAYPSRTVTRVPSVSVSGGWSTIVAPASSPLVICPSFSLR